MSQCPIAREHVRFGQKPTFETFDKVRPASTLVQVTSMLRPWQKVEIEAYAKVSKA
jgi:hypothetical protein